MAFDLCLSPREYFTEIVNEACTRRHVKTFPQARHYLVQVLEFYMTTENLYDIDETSGRRTQTTLAETLLRAANSEHHMRIELLKKLGDRSLYTCGFFGDSLQRKLVDIDYYVEMGCTAYGSLAESVREDTQAQIYKEFSKRFSAFVEVLSDISSQAHLQSEENIMRLFETYAQTGSDVAREKLLEKGLIAVPIANITRKKQ